MGDRLKSFATVRTAGRHRPRRHRAPALPPRYLVLLVILFAAGTVARGLEYANAEPGRTMSQVVERGLSLALGTPEAWGIALVATGLLVLASYALRIHVVVFFAHGIAAVVYLGVTVGLTQAAIEFGSGWGHIATPLLAMLWHVLLAVLTGPLPPRTPISEGAPGAADH